MSFVANDIWEARQIPEVKRNLALLAKTIAKYEPVSILVHADDKDDAISLLDGLNTHNFPIELIEFSIDDLWLRDTAPTFVTNELGKKAGINFNFNGWGEKQEHTDDSKVADFIIEKSGVKKINSNLVLEGGSFEIDGEGTAILTESSVLNDNRNPSFTKETFEKELKLLLGIKKIIWLKGIKGKDITDAHIDFYFNSKALVWSSSTQPYFNLLIMFLKNFYGLIKHSLTLFKEFKGVGFDGFYFHRLFLINILHLTLVPIGFVFPFF